MTKEEFKNRLYKLDAYWNKAKIGLYKEYALANNPYKEGDIITDHFHTIRIEIIGMYVSEGQPQCQYTGTQLNKDGTRSKKQADTTIYQSNIITKP